MITVMISTDLWTFFSSQPLRLPEGSALHVIFIHFKIWSPPSRALWVFPCCFFCPRSLYLGDVIENRTPVMEFHHEYRWSIGFQGNVLALWYQADRNNGKWQKPSRFTSDVMNLTLLHIRYIFMRYSEWEFIGMEIQSHRPQPGSHWHFAFLSQRIPGLEHLKWMT